MATQSAPDKGTDKAITEVQKSVDVETEKGYRGEVPDETPNHAYTVAGVVAGEPTPESPQNK